MITTNLVIAAAAAAAADVIITPFFTSLGNRIYLILRCRCRLLGSCSRVQEYSPPPIRRDVAATGQTTTKIVAAAEQ